MDAKELNRLPHKIIGPFQSTFISGRHTSDNYIVAHEILYSFSACLVRDISDIGDL